MTEQARDTGGLREDAENYHTGHVHNGQWCALCVEHGAALSQGQGAAHEEPPDHEPVYYRGSDTPSCCVYHASRPVGAAHEERGLDVERLRNAMLAVLHPSAAYAAEAIAREYAATPEAAPEEGQRSIAETPEDH